MSPSERPPALIARLRWPETRAKCWLYANASKGSDNRKLNMGTSRLTSFSGRIVQVQRVRNNSCKLARSFSCVSTGRSHRRHEEIRRRIATAAAFRACRGVAWSGDWQRNARRLIENKNAATNSSARTTRTMYVRLSGACSISRHGGRGNPFATNGDLHGVGVVVV